MLNLNTLIPDSNNPFYKIKYPLVSEEEKQKA
jgi:hypothetical protein